MAEFSESIEQFREDLEKLAEEMIIATGEYDPVMLEELWEEQGEGVILPASFFEDVLENMQKQTG